MSGARQISFEDAPFSAIHKKITAGTFMGQISDGYTLGIVGISLNYAMEPLGITSFWMGLIGAGSMFGIFFNEHEVYNYDDSCASDQEAFKVWFKSMLEQGIYLAPSQFETLFMSGAHSDEDIDRTIEAAGKAFADVAASRR